LAETYRNAGPFKERSWPVFLEASLAQLRSLGFAVVYIPYESIVGLSAV
jgi:hypothetical protein